MNRNSEPGATIGVGALLAQELDAVQVEHFHRVSEVLRAVLVDQGNEANHERNGTVPADNVGVTCGRYFNKTNPD
jgi:hypothetical protein